MGGQTYAEQIANEAAADKAEKAAADFQWRFNQYLKDACSGTFTARDVYAARLRQLRWWR